MISPRPSFQPQPEVLNQSFSQMKLSAIDKRRLEESKGNQTYPPREKPNEFQRSDSRFKSESQKNVALGTNYVSERANNPHSFCLVRFCFLFFFFF
jgi:hypothetical protein